MTAKRLTPAQRAALTLVSEGKIHGEWPGFGSMKWYETGFWQPLRAQAYQALRKAGLIQVAPVSGAGHVAVTLTDAGRAEIRRLEAEGCAPDCEERATCPTVGGVGHMQCGECPEHQKPRHHCGCLVEGAQ